MVTSVAARDGSPRQAAVANSPAPSTPVAPSRAQPLLVLKFGGSVLRGPDDLPRVAGEIYRQRRRGFAVVAVVSAFAGETDRLFAEAVETAGGTACAGIADLVSLGEARTAALLRIACDRIGLVAALCQPERIGLATTGGETGAWPTALDPRNLRADLARTALVIVPGFVGIGPCGGRTLLERGGSDFSAIFLGGELGAAAVRLYKDADGVFEADPALHPNARRFDEISWEDALEVARPLIQPRAVAYAAARRLPVEIEAIGSARVSRVGPRTVMPRPDSPPARVRVGLAGYGVVGQAVARRLAIETGFEIVSVLVRDPSKARDHAAPVVPTSAPADFLARSPDVVVDALSCAELSASLCADLLARGVHVASASKRMLCERDPSIPTPGTLACSAAVGGGAPMLETIARAKDVTGLWGVLNGTVNHVLSALARGVSFDEALGQARAAGLAEEDASADLSGGDAAAKLRILARHAFGRDLATVRTEGLDMAAATRIAASGERWVQLSRLTVVGGSPSGSVALVPAGSLPVKDIPGDEWNCLFVEHDSGTITRCVGRGAGGAATAEAVVADLYDLAALTR